jgi:hypothetical protein
MMKIVREQGKCPIAFIKFRAQQLTEIADVRLIALRRFLRQTFKLRGNGRQA